MNDDGSLVGPALAAMIGRDTPARTVTVSRELVRRAIEVVEGEGAPDATPPYVLLAFETALGLPPEPRAPLSLVTGDEWSLSRVPRIDERLLMTGRVDSAQDRFGSRFGHTLLVRTRWTFTDQSGASVGEVGRSTLYYHVSGSEETELGVPVHHQQLGGTPASAPAPAVLHAPLTEGDPLPSAPLRPTLGQVVRYCGLTWNFVPIFFDPDEARRAGLAGTIVPGPLKLALVTRYLSAVVGPRGQVLSVRCAHRRPDLTNRIMTLGGVVTRVEADGAGHRIECDAWIVNEQGERSVMAAATLRMPR